MKKGLLIVFTGNGKGKTTAALGLALRSCGHKMRVCMIQFVKGKWKSGECEAVKRFKGLIDIYTLGKGFIYNSEDIERHKESAKEAWQFAKKIMSSEEYSVVILDELTYLIKYRIIQEKEVVKFLSNKRNDLHVVVTGRKAPQSLIYAADLVTEMRDVKHPLKKGIKGQKGIEY